MSDRDWRLTKHVKTPFLTIALLVLHKNVQYPDFYNSQRHKSQINKPLATRDVPDFTIAILSLSPLCSRTICASACPVKQEAKTAANYPAHKIQIKNIHRPVLCENSKLDQKTGSINNLLKMKY